MHEGSAPNPVDSILFKNFMDDVETQIAKRLRKRFFDEGERINLKPESIRGVVKKLEQYYLFGIDADLNGRLFENFLSATMRGKDLGQYFTPRTLVKMGAGLANLETTDYVLDGCCGTGGFLIDALADMWAKVNANPSLTTTEKRAQRQRIADDQIYGIDFAKSPNLAKIARLNMYLHGDGGSRIFNVDALDRRVAPSVGDSPEEAAEIQELRDLTLPGKFDVVLTNPPFSKTYKRADQVDALILDQYTVAAGRANVLAKLLFFELYHHYLKPGGILVSVIDDGFLSGRTYKWFRETLRRMYVIKAVVSLPGDAFQRSEARVKTSFVVLAKRDPTGSLVEDVQPSIFMYACKYVGLDDPKRRRWMPGDDALRERAREEVATVVREYGAFVEGRGDPAFIVNADRAADRLDVKCCLVDPDWRPDRGTRPLSDVVSQKVFTTAETIRCEAHEGYVVLFTVKYDGTALAGRTIFPRTETDYTELYLVRQGDIVISNIAATYGSAALVPVELDGSVVSKEYTVLVARPGYHARVVWAVLRSPEIRAEMLLRSTGANRSRTSWAGIRNMAFPYPEDKRVAERFVREFEEAETARLNAMRSAAQVIDGLGTALGIDHDQAHHILQAFKPPT